MTEQMSLVECEDRAKDEGFDSATFEVVGPNGRVKAKWLDAYMGIFTVEGKDGFLMVGDAKHTFRTLGLHCENFQTHPYLKETRCESES